MIEIRPVELVDEPTPAVLEGRRVYTCAGSARPSGRKVIAVLHPPVAGMSLPYAKGSVILGIVDGGTAWCIGEHAGVDENNGHTLIASRDNDHDVLLGRGSGAWQAFMLYDSAHVGLAKAKDALTQIGNVVAELMDAALAGSGTTWRDATLTPILAALTTGDASGGTKGRT